MEQEGMAVSEQKRPVILYIAHRTPYPLDKGDRIRTFHTLRSLSRFGMVHLAALADEPVDAEAHRVLSQSCARLAFVPVGRLRLMRSAASFALGRTATVGAFSSGSLQRLLSSWTAEVSYDAVWVSSSGMASYARRIAARPGRRPSVIADLVDVDSQKWFDYADHSSVPKSWMYRCEGRGVRRLETGLAEWADALTLVSDAEAELFRSFCPTDKVRVVVNGVDLDYFQPRPNLDETGCVFVGALDYRPNVEGIGWFCREVWPELYRRRPDATLSLVGRRPVGSVLRLGRIPGVSVRGPTSDVRPHLAGAAVCIAPLRIARGVQNKVLEGMAMGKAVVTSPEALQGLRAQPDRELLVASSAREWIDLLDDLLGNPGRRQELGSAARAYALAWHQWDRCMQPLQDLIHRGCPRLPGPQAGSLCYAPLPEGEGGRASRSPSCRSDPEGAQPCAG